MEDPRPLGPVGMDTIIAGHGGLTTANTVDEARVDLEHHAPSELRPMWDADDHTSQPSDGADDEDSIEDSIYGDQDDAQSFIQPALSPMATRLTSPRTPAAEKAAAMDHAPEGGLFDMLDGGAVRPPRTAKFSGDATTDASADPRSAPSSSSHKGRSYTMAQAHTSQMPSPWRAGPKQLVVTEPTNGRSAMSGVFGSQSRTHRSSSIGENALKRLSKALPSISIPTPSFFLSAQSQKDDPTIQAQKSAPLFLPLRAPGGQPRASPMATDSLQPASSQPSPTSRMPYTLRKSTSDDSLLYHTLSRVSSLGDDDRFVNIKEQVNSRFKAIKDSWDAPSFKLPQFPSMYYFCRVTRRVSLTNL